MAQHAEAQLNQFGLFKDAGSWAKQYVNEGRGLVWGKLVDGSSANPSAEQTTRFHKQAAENKAFKESMDAKRGGPRPASARSYGGGHSGGRGGGGGSKPFRKKSRGAGEPSGQTTMPTRLPNSVCEFDTLVCHACSPVLSICSDCEPLIVTNTTLLSVCLPAQGEETEVAPLDVVTLLDTGANSNNFVSDSLASQLVELGFKTAPCNTTAVHYAQLDTGASVNKTIRFDAEIFNRLTEKMESISLVAMIVPALRYDLIIGLQTLIKLKLIEKLTDWCVSAQCVSDRCCLRPGQKESPAAQARIANPRRDLANHSGVSQKAPKATGSSGGASGSYKANLEGTASSMASIRAAGETLCTCELCSLQVGSVEFFGPEEEDDESSSLEATSDISDLLPDLPTRSAAGGSASTTDVGDTSAIFCQEGRLDASPEFPVRMRSLCEKYAHIFSDKVKPESAKIPPMVLEVDAAILKFGRLSARARPQSSAKIVKLREILNQLLRLGIIRASRQTVGSHVLLVVKKGSDKLRLCIDYRAINEATKSPEGWPIPNIDDLLREVGTHRPKFFGTMDMTQSYFQAPLRESDKKWTAFITPGGEMYEWNRVAMGLMGACSYFQRSMAADVFVDILHQIVKIYLDDLLVFAATELEFLANMEAVFQRCEKFNITLNPAKCRFGMAEVEYVGHKLSCDGISFTKDRTDEVAAMPEPQTAGEMKMFIGMVNYFHQHLRNVSIILDPLNQMLGKYEKKTAHRRLEWTPARRKAFREVTELVSNLPTLHFIDSTSPIRLQTDASIFGIGAYLFQIVDGVERPVAFLSKSLNKTQRKWAIPDKEAYAIFYALKKWDHLLRDAKFILQTDHENLTYINFEGTAKVRRWKLLVQEYNFQIEFIKGEDNVVADPFSRLCLNGELVDEGPEVPKDLSEVQANELMSVFLSNDGPDELLSIFMEMDAVTELCAFIDDDAPIPQSILDELKAVHNAIAGHSGVKRTVLKLKRKGVKMKHMRDYVDKFIKQCPLCQKLDERRLPVHVKPLTLASYRAMQRLQVDAIGPLPKTGNGFEYILVIIDTFSRWVMLYPTKSTGADECAKAFIEHFGLFGVANEVVSDNGPQLKNETVAQALELLGAKHNLNIAYSSEENGIVERENKEIIRHIRGFVYDSKAPNEWDDLIPFVQRILNAEVASSHGFSPADIVFGKAINLDRSVLMPNKVVACRARTDITEYVSKMIEVQKFVIDKAAENQQRLDAEHVAARGGQHITEFAVHSYVTIDYPESVAGRRAAPTKVNTPRKGPLLVLSSKDHLYVLKDLVNDKVLAPVHVTRLRKFIFDTSRATAEEIATHDNMEHYVGAVLDHRPRDRPESQRRALEFRIRWAGYDASYDTWEPWPGLRSNEVVHAYMRTHGMVRIISPLYSQPNAQGGGGGGGGGGIR